MLRGAHSATGHNLLLASLTQQQIRSKIHVCKTLHLGAEGNAISAQQSFDSARFLYRILLRQAFPQAPATERRNVSCPELITLILFRGGTRYLSIQSVGSGALPVTTCDPSTQASLQTFQPATHTEHQNDFSPLCPYAERHVRRMLGNLLHLEDAGWLSINLSHKRPPAGCGS